MQLFNNYKLASIGFKYSITLSLSININIQNNHFIKKYLKFTVNKKK